MNIDRLTPVAALPSRRPDIDPPRQNVCSCPVERFLLPSSSQLPLFHALGTPDKDKKHVIFETTHGNYPPREWIRKNLDWLDKYLGPVRRN